MVGGKEVHESTRKNKTNFCVVVEDLGATRQPFGNEGRGVCSVEISLLGCTSER